MIFLKFDFVKNQFEKPQFGNITQLQQWRRQKNHWEEAKMTSHLTASYYQ